MIMTALRPSDIEWLLNWGLQAEALAGVCRIRYEKGESVCLSGHLLRCLDGLCAKGVLFREGRGYRIADPARLRELGAGEYGYVAR